MEDIFRVPHYPFDDSQIVLFSAIVALLTPPKFLKIIIVQSFVACQMATTMTPADFLRFILMSPLRLC